MPKVSVVHSHWPKLIENLQASPLQFYAAVEEAVSRRLIPDTMSSRIDWQEGGMASANREYLRIKRGPYAFDVCGAPFGTGFFVSTWLVEERNSLGILEIAAIVAGLLALPIILIYLLGFSLGMLVFVIGTPVLGFILVQYLNDNRQGWDDFLMLIPYVGIMYERLARPSTYYKTDTAIMFQQAVQSAVMEIVDGMTEAKGIRGLSEFERKPIMHAVAGR